MSNSPEMHHRQRAVLDIPLNRHLGIVFDSYVYGVATSHFVGTPALGAFDGKLHGGVLSVLFEAAAFLALAPLLQDTQHAVTHDLHVSLMRPVPIGARCDLTARVMRSGRTLVFLEVSAHVDGKLVASGRITKSIVLINQT